MNKLIKVIRDYRNRRDYEKWAKRMGYAIDECGNWYVIKTK